MDLHEDCGGGVCGTRGDGIWDTPGDDDQTDEGPEAGADLDLHFTHPFAVGDGLGWFDQPFDCFWFNPNPNWAAGSDGGRRPQMLLDDKDGAGPEILVLLLPEDGQTYRIGVHTWTGLSLATVRIYIDGILIKEIPEDGPGVALEDKDLWDIATIASGRGDHAPDRRRRPSRHLGLRRRSRAPADDQGDLRASRPTASSPEAAYASGAAP